MKFDWNIFWITIIILVLLSTVIILSIIVKNQDNEITEVIVETPICKEKKTSNVNNTFGNVENSVSMLSYIKSKTDLGNLIYDFSKIDPSLGCYLYPGWVFDMKFNNNIIQIKYGTVTNQDDCIFKTSTLSNTYTNKNYGYMPQQFRRCIANCKPWAILTKNDTELCKNFDNSMDSKSNCCTSVKPYSFMPRTILSNNNFKAGGFILPIKKISGANQYDMYYFSIQAKADGIAQGTYLQIYTGNSTWYTLYPALSNNWQTIKINNPVTWNINQDELLAKPRIRIKNIEKLFSSGKTACSNRNSYKGCLPNGEIIIELQQPQLYQMNKIRPLWGKIKFKCEDNCPQMTTNSNTDVLNYDILRCWIEVEPNQWLNSVPEWVQPGAAIKLISPLNSKSVFAENVIIATVYPKLLDISLNMVQGNIQESNNLYSFYPSIDKTTTTNLRIPLRINFQDNEVPENALNNLPISNFKQNLLPSGLKDYDVIIVPNDFFQNTGNSWFYQASTNSFCFDDSESLVESYLCYDGDTPITCKKGQNITSCKYRYNLDGKEITKTVDCPTDFKLQMGLTNNNRICAGNQYALKQ